MMETMTTSDWLTLVQFGAFFVIVWMLGSFAALGLCGLLDEAEAAGVIHTDRATRPEGDD